MWGKIVLKRARGRKGAAKGKGSVEKVAGERGTPKKEASKRGVGRREAPEAVAPRVGVDAPGVGGEKRVDALCARYVAARDERDHLNDVLESLRIQIEQVVDSYSNLESDSEDSEESE